MFNRNLYFYADNDEGLCTCYLAYANSKKDAAKKMSKKHSRDIEENHIEKVTKELLDENDVIDVFEYASYSIGEDF